MLESKVRTKEEIISRFHDGQIIAIGGQTGQNMPERIMTVFSKAARNI